MPAGDPLTGEEFLAVAAIDAGRGDGRIRLAAALDAVDVEQAAGAAAEEAVTVAWDRVRDDLRGRIERRVGSIVLTAVEGPAPVGSATTGALLDHVRATGLAALCWTDGARRLRHRVAFARRVFGDVWPDLSDAALLTSLDEWLAPLLAGATGRSDIEAVDVERVLRTRLAHGQVPELDRVAPLRLAVTSGRQVPIDYEGDQPTAAVRVQELFGTATHPTVADGRVPVLLQLLSPAGRPVQVTSDLPGFWSGSWASVRKDMAGRYPKHSWPVDP